MKTAKLEGDKVPGKRIKSTDPRKPDLVALFKRLVCCSKVTELAERNGCFFARCLAYRPVNGRQTFQNLGVFSLWGDRGATIDPAEQLNATTGGQNILLKPTSEKGSTVRLNPKMTKEGELEKVEDENNDSWRSQAEDAVSGINWDAE
jgi:hypothetical protein